MRRITYSDKYTTIMDVFDAAGMLQARRVTFKNEHGSVEKEYHRVFQGDGVTDPGIKGDKYHESDDGE